MATLDKDALTERYLAYMSADFGVSSASRGSVAPPEARVANACEYMAFQMGQINRNLARLVDHLEKSGPK